MERLSVVGLGKLGLCLAACYAERGFPTLGVDIEPKVVQAVNAGQSPWYEPRLAELLAAHGGNRLRATTDHARAIAETDITIVLVATPSNPDGSFSNRFVESALTSLGEAFGRSGKPYHLFVISSTVMPGSITGSFIPLLERVSGRQLGVDFDVCYDPDFVALGNVIAGFFRPDLVVIGESRPEAGARVAALHERLCENQPVVSRLSLINAELAKVALNAYITVKISFANALANLCERVPGGDVDQVTRAIGADRRISPYYFQGGLSFGGTCFPRDTKAYLTVAERVGAPADLIMATDRVNRAQDAHLAAVTLAEVRRQPRATVAVMGLAFTPNTAVITESAAIKLIQALLAEDIHVIAYDPLAIDATRAVFGSAVTYVDDPHAALAEATVAVVTLRDRAMVQAIEAFTPTRPVTIIDCWRQLANRRENPNVTIIGLGRARA